jgi:hypothetical protein
MTREQAEAMIEANLTRRMKRVDEQTKRNMPATTSAATESLAQAQGRIGGLTAKAGQTDETVTE